MPNGDTCDSLTTDVYEVSCARNPRVKFKVNLRGSSQYVTIRFFLVIQDISKYLFIQFRSLNGTNCQMVGDYYLINT